MKRLALAALLSALAPPARAWKKEAFKLIHVADLAAALKSSRPPMIFDANDQYTRANYGVIPGAVLLTNYKKFDLSVLPADKAQPVVFYCANPKCMASHGAAKRAAKAGYQDVSVMMDGIMGWKDAGQPVEVYTAPGKSSKPKS